MHSQKFVSALYMIVLIIPWLFLYEVFPFYSSNITVTVEILIYIAFSIILGITLIYINKDIKKLKNPIGNIDTNHKFTGDNKGNNNSFHSYKFLNVYYKTLRILILITFCFLILILILIGISYFL
jgi:hypothetical protein